jgi:hypothetical protein
MGVCGKDRKDEEAVQSLRRLALDPLKRFTERLRGNSFGMFVSFRENYAGTHEPATMRSRFYFIGSFVSSGRFQPTPKPACDLFLVLFV